jgi:hypothetical protein
MKDSENIHKKVQEMCDCYATTDPLKEMSDLIKDPEIEAAAIKWVALAALHGVNANAEKVTITSGDDGKTTVIAEYRIAELPSPGDDVGRKVFETFRDITHIEAEKGKTAMALGIRDSSIELNIEINEEDAGRKIIIDFPQG